MDVIYKISIKFKFALKTQAIYVLLQAMVLTEFDLLLESCEGFCFHPDPDT